MKIEKRLDSLFETARKTAVVLKKAVEEIKPIYPLDSNFREELSFEKIFIIDSILFRFAKLQDFLGNKIFKLFLEFEERSVEGISFLEVLKFLEDEEILNIDLWSMFREVRNELSHDYPDDFKISENINFVIENTDKLISILDKIEQKYKRLKALK